MEQPDTVWHSLLRYERDVVAQVEVSLVERKRRERKEEAGSCVCVCVCVRARVRAHVCYNMS